MKLRMLTALTAALALAGLPGCDNKTDHQATDREKGSHPDQAFLEAAAKANLGEAELGRLAVKQANDQEVKKFAQRMVDDHTGANRELLDLAKRKNVHLPNRPDDAHEREAARLGAMSG